MKKLLLSVVLLGSAISFAQNVFPTAVGTNVGIGTTSPSSKLEITDSTGKSGLRFTNLTSSSDFSNSFNYYDNPVDKVLTVNRSGDVILGPGGSIFSRNGVLTSNRIFSLNGFNLHFVSGNPNVFAAPEDGVGIDPLSLFFINNAGNVGIGTAVPDAKLAVNGLIHTKEVKVDLVGWPDFVFEKEYTLPTLQEVEKQIVTNGHLANIPSAKEVETNGLLLGEMNKKLLQKIEELTLYAIEQNKTNEKQSKEITELKALVNKLINK